MNFHRREPHRRDTQKESTPPVNWDRPPPEQCALVCARYEARVDIVIRWTFSAEYVLHFSRSDFFLLLLLLLLLHTMPSVVMGCYADDLGPAEKEKKRRGYKTSDCQAVSAGIPCVTKSTVSHWRSSFISFLIYHTRPCSPLGKHVASIINPTS